MLGLPHVNLVKGIAAAMMHFRSDESAGARLAALIAKRPAGALAQISGLDANSDVVAEGG